MKNLMPRWRSSMIYRGGARRRPRELVVEGVSIVVVTTAGQTAREVSAAAAAAINADPTLTGLGVSASSLGTELATTGAIDSVDSTDAGITLSPNPSGVAVPALGAPATLTLSMLTLAAGVCFASRRSSLTAPRESAA